jgi:hypothetical protein
VTILIEMKSPETKLEAIRSLPQTLNSKIYLNIVEKAIDSLGFFGCDDFGQFLNDHKVHEKMQTDKAKWTVIVSLIFREKLLHIFQELTVEAKGVPESIIQFSEESFDDFSKNLHDFYRLRGIDQHPEETRPLFIEQNPGLFLDAFHLELLPKSPSTNDVLYSVTLSQTKQGADDIAPLFFRKLLLNQPQQLWNQFQKLSFSPSYFSDMFLHWFGNLSLNLIECLRKTAHPGIMGFLALLLDISENNSVPEVRSFFDNKLFEFCQTTEQVRFHCSERKLI